jgi:uncharacterized protein (DUF1499 family)
LTLAPHTEDRQQAIQIQNSKFRTYFVGFLDDLEAFFPMAEVIHCRRERKI